MTFAERLKELRTGAELTQEALAMKAGVSIGNVRNYEQGIRLPTFPIVVKLAAALDVTCEAFAECSDVSGVESSDEKPRGKK